MSAKRTFRRIDIDTALKELLNAPKIPEEERELSREEALKIMTEGFRNLLNQGYSIKGIVEYLKKTDCPIKDIKQGEIARFVNAEDRYISTKRKYRRTAQKEETEINSEISTGNPSGFSPELKQQDKTQRGGLIEKEKSEEKEALNLKNKGSFSLGDDLPLDEI